MGIAFANILTFSHVLLSFGDHQQGYLISLRELVADVSNQCLFHSSISSLKAQKQ